MNLVLLFIIFLEHLVEGDTESVYHYDYFENYYEYYSV